MTGDVRSGEAMDVTSSGAGGAAPAAAWRRRPGYLDTATYGLPPNQTVEVSHRVIDEWHEGAVLWSSWNDATDAARLLFSSFVGVAADSVSVGPATVSFAGLIAASLSGSADVVMPEGDFTSLVFPFLTQTDRGVTVHEVPIEALADSVDGRTTVVAWSAVQSSDGRIADTAAVLEAAERVGALTVIDATQAAGWLPLPIERVDVTICSAYKWLCCPRGTAFMVTSPRVRAECRPNAASWFSSDDMYADFYGSPLRQAVTARRFDVSPAWFAWTGAVASLTALTEVGLEVIHEHDVRLADGLRAELGIGPTGSAIVSVGGGEVEHALAAHGIKAATRANGGRLSFHLYNDDEDVALAAAALRDVHSAHR
jgi:selenocysteine lyase/cysteine desulfurase